MKKLLTCIVVLSLAFSAVTAQTVKDAKDHIY